MFVGKMPLSEVKQMSLDEVNEAMIALDILYPPKKEGE